MEEESHNSKCHGTCLVAFKELRNAYSTLEKHNTYEVPKETLLFLENISKNLASAVRKDCCDNSINYLLLLLTFLGKSLSQLGTRKEQCIFLMCREDTPGDTKESVVNRLLHILSQKNMIFVVTSCLCHTNSFVSYKACKVFLKYFERIPRALAGYKETIQSLLYEYGEKCDVIVLDLLHDFTKSFRKKLQGMESKIGLLEEKDQFAQVAVLTALLSIFNKAFSENSSWACGHYSYKNLVCKIKGMYQAEKLNSYILNVSCGSKEFLKASEFSQSEQLKSLVEQLRLFLDICLFEWRSIFAEAEFDSYVTFYKLKFLLLKVKDNITASHGMIQQALVFLTDFVDNKNNIIEYIDNLKFHGFGGRIMATVSDRGLTRVEEFDQSTRNLRLLVLIILNCFLLALNVNDSSFVHGALDLGDRTLSCLLAMLECASKKFDSCSHLAHIKQSTEKLCTLLVKVMMEDDDQLWRSVETLLCIYKRTSELCREYGVDSVKERIPSERFPHSLFNCLLKEISFDHVVCIDWLISDETCFSSALGHYLDIVISDFDSFLHSIDQTGRSPNSNLFRPDDSYIAGCFDAEYHASGSRGVNAFHFSKIHQKAGSDDVIDFSSEDRPVVIDPLSSDMLQLGPPVIGQNSVLIVPDSVHTAKTGIATLVNYSSSDSDDESDIDHRRTNTTTDTCFRTWDEDDTDEPYCGSTEKAIIVECESGSCSVEEKKHYVARLNTAGSEEGYFRDDSGRKTIMKSSIGNRNLYIMDQIKGDTEKAGQTMLMDFLIRLRLKLERIQENSLSNKDFKGLILQLNIIESRYDSLSI